MARAPNRWTNNAPVALITEEGDFNWFVRQLRLGAALLGSVKARAVVGVLDGIVWQANALAAYVVVGDCRGLLQFSTNNNAVEIEQWVTAADARGAGVPMLEWLIAAQHATTVKLFPIAGSEAVYRRLGFVGPGQGGYMNLVLADSAYWANVGNAMRYTGPPPPPPADPPPADPVAPPPPPPA